MKYQTVSVQITVRLDVQLPADEVLADNIPVYQQPAMLRRELERWEAAARAATVPRHTHGIGITFMEITGAVGKGL